MTTYYYDALGNLLSVDLPDGTLGCRDPSALLRIKAQGIVDRRGREGVERQLNEECLRRISRDGSTMPECQQIEIAAADDALALSVGNGKSTRIENVQYLVSFSDHQAGVADEPTIALAPSSAFRHPCRKELVTVASERRGWAFIVRLSILLSVLLILLLYAAHDWLGRRERTKWERPLNVALVVVQESTVAASALNRLRERTSVLEAQLDAEFRRYHPSGPRPFEFTMYGPVEEQALPPQRTSEGVWELIRYAWALIRFTRDVDHRALVPTRGFDARLYLVVRPPANSEQSVVEGAGEQGGRVGVAKAELADDMTDFALFVAAHELFHNLGATDKYGDSGHTLVPAGLAEPDLSPTFPQQKAEVMARNRPLSADSEVPPTSLDQLGIGPLTATEIGWAK